MATALVDGVELYYEETGSGDFLVLTHGSLADGTGFAPVVELLAERYRVVVWDRRGHSRSQDGPGPGSRAQDAADLARLIELVADGPVHAVGHSTGGNITLTLAITRPELLMSASVHEPGVFGILEGATGETAARALTTWNTSVEVAEELITAGRHREAVHYFVDNAALGPGAWDMFPEAVQSVLVANAATFLDELHDPTFFTIDFDALAATSVPLQLTGGTVSPPVARPVMDELTATLPAAELHFIDGAGHAPYATHAADWVASLTAFHTRVNS